jgi:CubicO group peptidase (beta-lactamase class C family)
MRLDSVFRIASMTKLITTLAVLMLHEEHGVDLDEPFARYLPEFRQPPLLTSFDSASRSYQARPAASSITIRQLLTHTSGFGYWFLSHELRALMGGEPEYYTAPVPLHEPGTRFTYGIGTDVLGQMIRPVSGMRLEQYFEQRIFGPLGMRDTAYGLPAEPRGSRLCMRAGQGASANCRTRLSRSRRAAESDCTLRHATICSCCGCCSMKAGSARRAYSARQASASSRATRSRGSRSSGSAPRHRTTPTTSSSWTAARNSGSACSSKRAAGHRTGRRQLRLGGDLQHLFLGRHPSLSGGRWSHAAEPVLCATEHPVCDAIEGGAYESFASARGLLRIGTSIGYTVICR